MAKLVVIAGKAELSELRIEHDVFIGRAADCDLVLAEPFSSRQHAKITFSGGDYVIEDLHSANGTLLNNRHVVRARLQDGDSIIIGDCQLKFVADDTRVPSRMALPQDMSMATVVESVDVEPARPGSVTSGPAPAETLRAHLEVIQDVAQTSCGNLEIRHLVEVVLEELMRVYRQADHAHALLVGFSEDGGELHLSAARAGGTAAQVGISRTLLKIATRDRKAVLASDVGENDQLALAASIVQHHLRSMMCSPLVVGARMLGAIQVDTAEVDRPFTMDDLQLLVTIAGQVAVVAENARLHRQIVAQQRLAAVGEAISSLAHCIKNVINGLQGGSYILDLGIKKNDSEKVAKGWEMVKRNSGFMGDLTKDMLAYCRTGALRRDPTDIGKLLAETLELVQESARQKGIEMSLDLRGDEPLAEVDATGLKRVVLNLLSNAVEACPEGSHVTVSTGVDVARDEIRITVQDDGPGIPPDVKKRLFEPFFTTKGSRGTGIGLALVKKVMDEHHGRVEVESEPGHGAAFHLTIPVQWDEEKTSLKQLKSATDAGQNGPSQS